MKRKSNSTLKNTLFALSWHYRISPGFTVWKVLNKVIGDVITLFEHTYLPAYIISCVENKKSIIDVLYFLIPIAALVAIKVTVNPYVAAFIEPKFNAKFKKAVSLKLYKKATSMEISKYDNSEFYNDFVWAMQEGPSHITDSFNTFCDLLSYTVVALIAGTYIVTADAIALIAAAIIVPACFFTYKAVNKLFIKREEEIVPIKRKRDYISRIFYLPSFVKDMKQSNIAEKFQKDFKESSEELEKPINKYAFKICFLNNVNNSLHFVVWDGVFLTYLFYQALVLGKFALGQLLGIYNSGQRLIGNIQGITRIYPDFQKHSLYIEKVRTFLDTENEMPDNGKRQVPPIGDIRLKDICFTYPGNTEPTINGIDLKIKKGEKLALVGFNGAGKSTLIKLILRLYDPTAGDISFGESNIKEYPLESYRDRFGVLFQDFEIIAADVSQNISMSNDEFDVTLADKCVEKVGFTERLKTLPNGYKTQLTKEFSDDGINLSGGEAQKIAIARVLYSAADIIILDEPSSALDPIAEYQLNRAVTELSKDKTVIIISHRLSTTRFVDKICMLEKGRIIEIGSHNELLASGGKYAEMFSLQAEKYML